MLGISADEYRARVAAVREDGRRRELDALLLTTPENIYYLTGLNYQGYFTFTALLVPMDGAPVLIARWVEAETVAEQAPELTHVEFRDGAPPSDAVAAGARDAGIAAGKVGVSLAEMSLPVELFEAIQRELPDVEWVDAAGLVEERRMVKSPAEIECTRRAAALGDRAMQAGIAVAGVGANEREVAAKVYEAMILGGGEHPGFVPLVRSTRRLTQPHVTWQDHMLEAGEVLFLEMSASVHRYHAPLTRLVHVGHAPDGVGQTTEVARAGIGAILSALSPGATAGEVYDAWLAVVDEALGHSRYRPGHCGYLVGIGFPPSWVGGSTVVSLRAGSTLRIQAGMAFHVFSWIFGQGIPDYGVSDTALVGRAETVLLTTTERAPRVIR